MTDRRYGRRGRRRGSPLFTAGTVAALAAVGCVIVPSAGAAGGSSSTTTKTFTTPGSHSFKVPAGVRKLTINAIGAAGGDCMPTSPGGEKGGQGASVAATVPVKPGEKLFVGVGGVGGTCSQGTTPPVASPAAVPAGDTVPGGAGGTGGGGAGGEAPTVGGISGSGGGGASGVAGKSLKPGGSALVVAGGGGGANVCTGASGGNAGEPGGTASGTSCSGAPGHGGDAGTKTAGGAGGAAGDSSAGAGASGMAGAGGAGGYGSPNSFIGDGGGGGGGGGYYGGGGGGGGAPFGGGGGGGGGASFTSTHASHVSSGLSTASASVTITYTKAAPPKATTRKATGVSSNSATLHGSVNPEGAKTTYVFQWGRTASYGHTTSKHSLKASRSAHSVAAAISGLKPGTKYHFRVVAHNANGTARGRDMTFVTPSTAPAFTG